MKSMNPSPDFGTPCSGQSVNWNWRTVRDWPSCRERERIHITPQEKTQLDRSLAHWSSACPNLEPTFNCQHGTSKWCSWMEPKLSRICSIHPRCTGIGLPVSWPKLWHAHAKPNGITFKKPPPQNKPSMALARSCYISALHSDLLKSSDLQDSEGRNWLCRRSKLDCSLMWLSSWCRPDGPACEIFMKIGTLEPAQNIFFLLPHIALMYFGSRGEGGKTDGAPQYLCFQKRNAFGRGTKKWWFKKQWVAIAFVLLL